MSVIYTTESLRCNTSNIVNKIISEADGEVVFVVPEGIKAAVERIVINSIIDRDGSYDGKAYDIAVKASYVKGDVLSFVKLAERILESCGRSTMAFTDTVVMRNAIYRILASHVGEFEVFGKLVGKFEYVDMLINLIGDFTRYGIDEDKICEAYELVEDSSDEVYSAKLHDLKLLIGYLNELGAEFELNLMSDPINEANKLLEKIVNDKSLLDTRRYRSLNGFIKSSIAIIGFGTSRSFTPEEMKLITLLSAIGSNLIVTSLYKEDASGKLYEFGNLTVKMLTKNIPNISVVPVDGEFRYDVAGDQKVYLDIINNYANEDLLVEEGIKTNNIVSTTIRQLDDRLAYIANEIIRLTRTCDYRYRDIRIACVDEAIIPRFKGVLEVFGLDAFIDQKIVISNTPVFRFVSNLIELPLHNYDYKDVLRFLRTGVARVLPEDVDAFENYCVRYNITNANRIFNNEFFKSASENGVVSKYADRIYRNGSLIYTAEYLWDKVVTKVLENARTVAEEIKAAKTISSKATLLAEYLEGYNSYVEGLASELSERGETDRASALVRGHKEVMSLLASFTDRMNDVEISHEAFCSLIRIDMRNKSQGSIPIKIDSIEIVPVNQAYLTNCKVMFLIGARSDNFPFTATNEGIMTRSELSKMAEDMKIDLPDKAVTKNKSEFITASLLLGTVSDKLYIIDDLNSEPSQVSNYLTKFANEVNLNCFEAPVYGKMVERRHDFTSARIDSLVMQSLYEGKNTTSVTDIEQFNTCPMQYMLEKALKIRERENNIGVQAKSVGSIIHEMFETTLSRLIEEYKSPAELAQFAERLTNDKELLDSEAKKAFDDYTKHSKNPNEHTSEFAVNPGRKAMRIFAYALPQMLEELGSSNYIPCEFESRIQDFENPLMYETSDGTTFQFRGSIDRVDKDYEGEGLRIIDYKTGNKKFDVTKTLAGVQVQLFAYAKALQSRGESINDAGYFEIGLSVPKDGKPLEVKPELTKLEVDDFATLVEFVDYSINESCNRIMEGEANAQLNSKEYSVQYSHCSFCAFSGACGNDVRHPRLNCKHMIVKPSDSTDKNWKLTEAIKRMKEIMDNNE